MFSGRLSCSSVLGAVDAPAALCCDEMEPAPHSVLTMLLPLLGLLCFVPPFFVGYFIGKGKGYKEGVEASTRLGSAPRNDGGFGR